MVVSGSKDMVRRLPEMRRNVRCVRGVCGTGSFVVVGSTCVGFNSSSCGRTGANGGDCSDSSAWVFGVSYGTGIEVGGSMGSCDGNGSSLCWSSSWSTRVKEECDECGTASCPTELAANGASGGSKEGNGGLSVVTRDVSVSSVAMLCSSSCVAASKGRGEERMISAQDGSYIRQISLGRRLKIVVLWQMPSSITRLRTHPQ